jgi:hypothetical protein
MLNAVLPSCPCLRADRETGRCALHRDIGQVARGIADVADLARLHLARTDHIDALQQGVRVMLVTRTADDHLSALALGGLREGRRLTGAGQGQYQRMGHRKAGVHDSQPVREPRNVAGMRHVERLEMDRRCTNHAHL